MYKYIRPIHFLPISKRSTLQGIVYAVGLLNFPEVEGLWQSFWQGVGLTSNSYKRKLCLDFTKREGNESHGEGAADVLVYYKENISLFLNSHVDLFLRSNIE